MHEYCSNLVIKNVGSDHGGISKNREYVGELYIYIWIEIEIDR